MAGAHRRYNPLLGEWILCSRHRLARPWLGEKGPVACPPPRYDPQCYMCPGNSRAKGVRNPDYEGVFLFDNDFPALDASLDAPVTVDAPPFFVAKPERGCCRVLCFSPRHDAHFAGLTLDEIRGVVDAWAEESRRLRSRRDVSYVQIFENRGAMMGASNAHPHGQIWAVEHVPSIPSRKSERFAAYSRETGRDLLGDYLGEELRREERIIEARDHWVQLVPFWAVWPFETLLLPRRPVTLLSELDDDERHELAVLLRSVASRYDRLFETAFPYSFGWYERPEEACSHQGFRLHASYMPPLVRSASIRKFLVGYELTCEPQRDFLPEEAAARLRDLAAAESEG